MSESWTQRYFETLYLRRWALGQPDEEVLRNVDFLLDELAAAPGDSLLDVGCGQGRYSIAFASRGMSVTGLDASPSLLTEARRLALQACAEVNWIRGDMRRLPAEGFYRLAVLLNAFGFFDTDEENEGVMRQMDRVIAPAGRVVVAVANGTRILNAYEPHGLEERNGRRVSVRREFDNVRRVLREEVTVEQRGFCDTAERRQRLYGSTELVDVALRAGLTVHSVYGNMCGEAFDDRTSSKIVLICRHRGARA